MKISVEIQIQWNEPATRTEQVQVAKAGGGLLRFTSPTGEFLLFQDELIAAIAALSYEKGNER